MKYEDSKLNGVIQMIEAGMTQKQIADITGVSYITVHRVSRVLTAAGSEDWEKVADFLQDVTIKSLAIQVLRIKGVTIPQAVQQEEPKKETPAGVPAMPDNIEFMKKYVETMFQYMTALNKKLCELDANMQKVMIDCQRQSNANTDVLMTELSKLTGLCDAIKCNTRKPK